MRKTTRETLQRHLDWRPWLARAGQGKIQNFDNCFRQWPCQTVRRVRITQEDHHQPVVWIEQRASGLAREAATVADHLSLANFAHAEAESVAFVRLFDGPRWMLRLAL